jgi:hypothetical protein
MPMDKNTPPAPESDWSVPAFFETEGHRPQPRRADPLTGKQPEIRPPKGGSSVRPPHARPVQPPPKR